MQISILKSKLHQARITDANLEYVGSITIDTQLMAAAEIYAWQKVLVVDLENGARFETYVIPGDAGSGIIQVNGAAAHLVTVGDRVIVMAFAQLAAPPPADWIPKVVVLDENNQVCKQIS